MNKICERCNVSIPDDFNNLLCMECYYVIAELDEKQKQEIEEQKQTELLKNPTSPTHPDNTPEIAPVSSPEPQGEALPPEVVTDCTHKDCGILDPNYTHNPEMEDKNQILANLAQFIYSHDPVKKRPGKLLWYPTRNMYTFIRNYARSKVMSHPQYPKQIWKPYIVDVGCGSGVGSNVLSQEAHFVWGIDKNEWSIEFAREAFNRERNNIYYSGQLTFDVFDIMSDTREIAQFDMVVAIEVIEHIRDVNRFLNALKRFTRKDKKGDCHILNATEFFFSTPNRNFHKIRKDRPENVYHVSEYTTEEYVKLLRRHFEKVEILNQKGEPIPEDSKIDEVILAKCIYPI